MMRVVILLFLVWFVPWTAAAESPLPDAATHDPDKLAQEFPGDYTRHIQKLFATAAPTDVKTVTAKPRLHKGTEAYRYRTAIRTQTQIAKANFAGEWVLITVGCGTGCSSYFLMHAETGTVVNPRLMTVNGNPLFRPDRSLLVVGGSVGCCDTVQEAKEHGVWGGPKAWVWENRRFVPVPLD